MQQHEVKSLDDLQKLLLETDKAAHISLPKGGEGVLVSNSLWDSIHKHEQKIVDSKASLEKAVSLLIQESKKTEQIEQAVARSEEQFIRVFSTSLTPMRIEDWSLLKAQLTKLATRLSPVEIKEYFQEAPEKVQSLLKLVKVLDCNNAFKEAIDAQYSPEYLNAFEKIIPESCYPQIVSMLLGLVQGDTDIRQNIKVRRYDGGLRDIRLHMSLYSDDEESASHMLVSYWDVTQQKRITRNLQVDENFNVEDKNRALIALNGIREGVITTDQAGNIINLNPTAERLTGWESDYFQRPLGEVFSPENGECSDIGKLIQACRERSSVFESDGINVLNNKAGETFWLTFSVSPVISDDSVSGFIIVFNDVSESKQLLDQIKQHKNQDPITKLYNRQAFKGKLTNIIKQAQSMQSQHALLLVDLDQFHVVNDTCGHTAGDLLLTGVADIIRKSVRSGDVVGRIGGDEFGILLSRCGGDAAIRIAQNILETVKKYRFSYEGKQFKVRASIGIVLIDETAESVDKLLIDADSVVQVAKDSGSNRVQIYDEKQEVLLQKQDQLRWFTKINYALENNLLVLSYQKIRPTNIDASENDIHYELLIRMLDDDGGLIPPGAFLPAAERYNLMPQIDRWVVKNAFTWIEINLHRNQTSALFSINLSGHSIGEETFLDYVEECFDKHHVLGSRICFEITETMAINNMDNTLNFIERFKSKGCKFSLDDFGTGFSSYGYLKTLPVDFLKIDGSFVSKIVDDPIDLAMVKSINEVGHIMNRKTIAEYVEDEETMALLREIGVDYAQGYGIESPRLLETLVKKPGFEGRTGTDF